MTDVQLSDIATEKEKGMNGLTILRNLAYLLKQDKIYLRRETEYTLKIKPFANLCTYQTVFAQLYLWNTCAHV